MNRSISLALAGALVLCYAAPALADPPSVQVIVPVVDGGVTVVVAPGTATPAAGAGPAVPPASPSAPAPGSTVPSATASVPASAPRTPAAARRGGAPVASSASSGSDQAPPSTAPTIPLEGGPAATPPPRAPLSPTPALPGPPPRDASPLHLPRATPTYLGTRPAQAPSAQGPSAPRATAAPGSGSTSPAGPERSAGPTKIGVFGHSTERAARFEEKMGRDVDILGVFPSRGSWSSIMDPWWLDRAPQGFHGTLDVGVPLWQEDGDLATAADGGYDEEWEKLGRLIHDRYPGSSVRIGWEFNLGGWKHHATPDNAEQWKKAFRHASIALRKGGPSLLVTWNPNKGKGDSLPDATAVWPGDDVVDLVGLDAYDWWPAYNEKTWPDHRDGDQGWRYWVEFARAHHKRFTVPEWGVAPGNDHGGGDNPFYIEAVTGFLAEQQKVDGIVHSWVYFDETDGYIANSIADGQVPLAGEALRKHLPPVAEQTARPTPRAGARDGASGAAKAAAASDTARRSEGSDTADRAASEDTTAPPTSAPAASPSEGSARDRSTGAGWGGAPDHGPVPR